MTLPVLDSRLVFQTRYQPVVADLVRFSQAALGSNLHSLYLYGSVARKTAKPNHSNIDVIIVIQQSEPKEEQALRTALDWRFNKQFPFVCGINLTFLLLEEVASLDSVLSWGFVLRHCSLCLYGNNLAECFGDYIPSWEIAKFWNQDIQAQTTHFRTQIGQANSESEQVYWQQQFAKKTLRACYSLVMYKDRAWYDEPSECGQHFLRYYPEHQQAVERLQLLLEQRMIAKRSVIGLIDSFSSWLITQYQKTEFRIG